MNFLVLAIIIVSFVFKLYVSILNYKHRHHKIPDIVSNLYDKEKYQTWLSYTMDNFKFGLVSELISTGILLSMLLFGFFGFLEESVAFMTPHPILSVLVFMFLFYIIQFIVGIPLSYYKNFVIEASYGFNKMTRGLFVKDLLKNLLLTILLGGGVLTLLTYVFELNKYNILLFSALAYGVIILIVLALFTLNGFFSRLFNKLTPLEESSLKEKIELLSTRLGFKIKRVYIMDASKRSSKLNAYFSGLGATKEVVLFDTLIAKTTEDEILAVLAHELGHATHKDTTKLLVEQLFIIGLYVSLLSLVLTQDSLYSAFNVSNMHFGFGLILFTILIEPLQMLVGIVSNNISRGFEYKADAFASRNTSKEAMSQALKTLAVENYANLTPHPLYEFLYYSHPNIAKRLEAIAKV